MAFQVSYIGISTKKFKLSRVVPPSKCENFFTEQVEQDIYHFTGDWSVEETTNTRKVFGIVESVGIRVFV